MQTEIFDLNEFKQTGKFFFQELLNELIELGVPEEILRPDHLCYRTSTQSEYEHYKHHLSCTAELLTESSVNGRSISTFLLHQPIHIGSYTISLVELPAPKPGTPYMSGFEHAEFVIAESFEHFTARFPHLPFIESGNKSFNPELCLKMQGKQAKFHHLSLDRVIEIEKAQIKDIIFDLDGTLIQSRKNIYEINRIVFSELTGRDISLQESIDTFHPEFSKLFESFGITCPIKKAHAITSWGLVSDRFSYQMFEGIIDMLNRLVEINYRLHLWTARDEYSARKILNHLGIESYFSTLSFASDQTAKPHENSLQFDWRSADKNQTMVIGDSPTDIKGAKNINALGIGALWDIHAQKNALITAGAEIIFTHPSELMEWMNLKTPPTP